MKINLVHTLSQNLLQIKPVVLLFKKNHFYVNFLKIVSEKLIWFTHSHTAYCKRKPVVSLFLKSYLSQILKIVDEK